VARRADVNFRVVDVQLPGQGGTKFSLNYFTACRPGLLSMQALGATAGADEMLQIERRFMDDGAPRVEISSATDPLRFTNSLYHSSRPVYTTTIELRRILRSQLSKQ